MNQDKRLIAMLQTSFPITPHPFLELGERLGLTEEECLERIRHLKESGIIREITAVFDSRALGYESTLVALKLDPLRLDRAAAIINQHPGVSHNYAREHQYNLWFTLTLPPHRDIEGEVRRLAQEAEAQDWLNLPAFRVFKISALFVTDGATSAPVPPPTPRTLSSEEKDAVRRLQQDLPLTPQPFQHLAQGLALGEEGLLKLLRNLLGEGVMRRYAALLHHYKLGFQANGLGCWQVPPSRIEEVGECMASSPEVSHCYERQGYDRWPYNLYTMVHSFTREECQNRVSALAEKAGVDRYILLFSFKEYKRGRVRYYE